MYIKPWSSEFQTMFCTLIHCGRIVRVDCLLFALTFRLSCVRWRRGTAVGGGQARVRRPVKSPPAPVAHSRRKLAGRRPSFAQLAPTQTAGSRTHRTNLRRVRARSGFNVDTVYEMI